MSWDSKVQNLLGHCTSHGAFGAEILHIPQVGDTQAIDGIWSETYITADPDDGISVMSNDPNVGARLSDFNTGPKKGDQIERHSVRYYVRAVEPDGEGGVVLVLERVT